MIGLGTSNLGIGIAVTLRNNYSNASNRVTASMRTMNDAQKRLLNTNLLSLRNFGAGVGLVGLGLAAGLNSSIKEVSRFDDVMQAVKANTAISTMELSKLKHEAMDLGVEFGQMPIEISKAMKDVSKAVDIKNLGTKGLFNLTKDALLLATVGDTDVGGEKGAAEILINIMSQFEMRANRSREVVEKLAMTANKTTTDVKGLAESFKYGGAEAHRLGLSLDESLTLFGMLGQAGLKGSLGGTTGGNFLRYLTKAVGDFRTKRQSEGLAMMGLRPGDIMDSSGNLLKLDVVLGRVKASLKGMSNIKRQNAMEAVFGVRGSRAEAVLNMLDKANFGAGFKELLKYLGNSKGYAAAQMAVRMETYKKRVDKLNASIFMFKEALSSTFVPILIPLINKLAGGVVWLAKAARSPLGKLVLIIGTVTIALATLGGVLAMIGGGLGSLLITSRTTFKGMVDAAKWAYRIMGFEALLFQRKASAAIVFNEGLGRWTRGKGGRMVSGKLAERYNRRFGGAGNVLGNVLNWLPSFGGVGKMLGRTGPLLSRFGGVLLRFIPMAMRFIPYIGIILTVLSLFVDFKDMLKGVLYTLGSVLQGLVGAFNFINPLSDSFLDWDKTVSDFQKANSVLRNSLWDEESSNKEPKQTKFYSPYVSKEYQDKLEHNINNVIKQNQTLNLNMDGEKVSKGVYKRTESLLTDGPPIK